MKKERSHKILIVLVPTVAVCAAIILIIMLIRKNNTEDSYVLIQSSVNAQTSVLSDSSGQKTDIEKQKEDSSEKATVDLQEPDDTSAESADVVEIPIPEKNLDWAELRKQNKDIYAWIYVPDTLVDYPVLQHPTDNSYYLDYNIDGTKGYPGCIYSENYNRKDFTDPHTVLYGHNMRNQTMFATLHNFEDENMVKEDHYIFIYTEDKTFVYQIFAAYDYRSIHLLANFDLTNEYVYEQYIKDIFKVKENNNRIANIREDITVTKEDRIITLSTCTRDDNSNYRFLVTGVLLNP